MSVDTQTLSATKQRELLQHERPARNTMSRERLATEYVRTGHLSFACSINSDLRGLKLDLLCLSVFPSPDCNDRSACLFSYLYEHVDSCEAMGTRLELRFRRSSTKQPTFIAVQSLEVQYIREAIWYLQHGAYMDACLRARVAATFTRAEKSSSSRMPSPRRGRPLAYFEDADVVQQRIETRCRVMGCQRRAEAVGSTHETGGSTSSMLSPNALSHANRELSTTRVGLGRLCDEHVALSALTRSPSKRGAFFPRGRPKSPLPLTHTPHYLRMLKYQSPLLKKSGASKSLLMKTWHLKYVAVFETPVGGFLCYYDKLAHCPGVTLTPKERRVIDLSSVICIRPESTAATTSAPLAFDIVTIYRTWTFAATDPEEYETWLQVLADAVEKQTSMAPDKRLRFPVRMMTTALAPQQFQFTRHESTSLDISSYGVCVCSGHEGETELYSWYFTEIHKWSVVYQQGDPCCLLSCQNSASAKAGNAPGLVVPSPAPYEILLQTTDAPAICQAIEFYVGKCMAKLEVLAICAKETTGRIRRGLSDSTLATGVPELTRFKSERLVGSPPRGAELRTHNDKRNHLQSTQHVVAGLPLKPVGGIETESDSGAAPAVALSPPKPTGLFVREHISAYRQDATSGHDGIVHASVCDNAQESSHYGHDRQKRTHRRSCTEQQEAATDGPVFAHPTALVALSEASRATDASTDIRTGLSACDADFELRGILDGEVPVESADTDDQPTVPVAETHERACSTTTAAQKDDGQGEGVDGDCGGLEVSELELDVISPRALDENGSSSDLPVPIIELSLSPIPLLESPSDFARAGRFDSSFSTDTLETADGDGDSDRFESFGYLECAVFEAADSNDAEETSFYSAFSKAASEVLRFGDDDEWEGLALYTDELLATRSSLPLGPEDVFCGRLETTCGDDPS